MRVLHVAAIVDGVRTAVPSGRVAGADERIRSRGEGAAVVGEGADGFGLAGGGAKVECARSERDRTRIPDLLGLENLQRPSGDDDVAGSGEHPVGRNGEVIGGGAVQLQGARAHRCRPGVGIGTGQRGRACAIFGQRAGGCADDAVDRGISRAAHRQPKRRPRGRRFHVVENERPHCLRTSLVQSTPAIAAASKCDRAACFMLAANSSLSTLPPTQPIYESHAFDC